MRLTNRQISGILDAVRRLAGADAKVSLYGSRLDDARRGGDVDLLVESSPPIGLLTRARIKTSLEQCLNLPVDVLAAGLGGPGAADSAFVAIARAQARRLELVGLGD